MTVAARERIQELTQKQVKPIREELDALVQAGRAEDAVERALRMLTAMIERATSEKLREALRRARSSEQLDPAQLQLLLDEFGDEEDDDESDDLHDDLEEEAEEPGDSEEAEKPRAKRGRKPLPDKLPRKVVKLPVADDERHCSQCKEERAVVGYDVSEVLEMVPVQFKVIQYHREKLACSRCKTGIVMGPTGERVYDGCLAGPNLLAQVVVNKFADHIPLHRQRALFSRMGAPIAPSTLGGWIARIAADCEPLVEALWSELMESTVVQTDATGIKVLDRDSPDGTRLGSMWMHLGDDKLCVLRYAPNGTGIEGPWKYLAGREGYIQADAANIFDRLFNGELASAIEVGCLAHGRRKFHALLDSDPRVARPLKLIAGLYRIERLANERELDAEARLRMRQVKSAPIVRKLKQWLLKTVRPEPPKSALAKACRYMLNHWEAQTRFLSDGRLALDNNRCEQQIRAVALGRNNYLFVGSDAGGHRAATLYSLMRTCALNDVDPQEWLSDVLTRLARGWPASRIAELLPHRWSPAVS